MRPSISKVSGRHSLMKINKNIQGGGISTPLSICEGAPAPGQSRGGTLWPPSSAASSSSSRWPPERQCGPHLVSAPRSRVPRQHSLPSATPYASHSLSASDSKGGGARPFSLQDTNLTFYLRPMKAE
ncbi:hypothetical protein PM082_019420 [Marasmius tenuissimus]|nr:hypothetical protein PM082_019420 [Marasmius tenuissimus]